jgi:hypothetical protein
MSFCIEFSWRDHGRARRAGGIAAGFTAFSMTGSLTNWGRTGFDGDGPAPWLHAELDQTRKTDPKKELRITNSHWQLN